MERLGYRTQISRTPGVEHAVNLVCEIDYERFKNRDLALLFDYAREEMSDAEWSYREDF
ncbi:MAG: hypothetical protein ABEJ03_02205 [Candidatus Nanohaloarchaea archaeon]